MVRTRKSIPKGRMATRRKAVPKAVKDSVWKIHNGNKIDGTCFVCGTTITWSDFDAGHVVSVFNGGGDDIDNLRPVCRACNGSMKTMNLGEYKAKYYPDAKVPVAASRGKEGPRKLAALRVKCPNCKGKGTLPARSFFDDPHKCPSCRKKGSVVATRAAWKKCRKCKGYGRTGLLDERCADCKGVGIVRPTS